MTLWILLCICRRTLAWISCEISIKLLGMPTHLDRYSLTAAGLYLMRLVSQMSGVDSQPPLCVSRCQLTSLSSFVQLPDRRSLPNSGRVEISSPKPLSGFAPKTDKGIVCLADHLHSVTLLPSSVLNDKEYYFVFYWENFLFLFSNFRRIFRRPDGHHNS